MSAPAAAPAALPLPLAPTRPVPVASLVFHLYVWTLVGIALAAYSVGPIPVQWMAQAGLVALAAGLILGRDRVMVVPGGVVLAAFVAWALAVNVLRAGQYAAVMPRDASLPYPLFLAVRYVGIFAFAAAFYLGLWLMYRGQARRVVDAVVWVGVGVALFGFYVYAAQILGLPEPPRTRMGTGGAATQATLFSSGQGHYRRMMGPFREPSHMAEWLLVPFFFSFARSGRWARTSRAILGAALVLTVSMGGMIAALGGAAGGLLLTNPFKRENRRRVVLMLAALAVLVGAAGGISVGAGDDAANILSILTFRVEEILQGGIGKSNRGYVVDFIRAHPAPPLGYGLGNSNIVFANYSGIDLPMSYLSLYVNVLYSAGVVGLLLLGAFMLRPVLRAMRARGDTELGSTPAFLMAYLATMVMYGVNSEELTVPFAVAAAALAYQVWGRRPARPAPAPSGGAP